jgi:acyl-CoA reductase-like NAD-dependent aldehyde dehydrogenase
VNEYFAGGIAVPFGGNKHSGFGREKGLEAVGNYCKTKSVVARI